MLFGPGADSGTFDYFTEAVNGKAKASRGDFTASEDDNTLVQGVENNKSALGYFGFAYYAAHKDKLRAVPIDGGKGPVRPEPRGGDQGHLQPAVAATVRVRQGSVAQAPGGEGVRQVHADRRQRARCRGRLSAACPTRRTSLPGSMSRAASSVRCSAAFRKSASRSTICSHAKASSNTRADERRGRVEFVTLPEYSTAPRRREVTRSVNGKTNHDGIG